MKNSRTYKMIALVIAIIFLMPLTVACSTAPAEQAPAPAAAQAQEAAADTTAVEAKEVAPVKVAVFTNLTGSNAADGEYAKRSFDVCLEMINERMGGIQSLGGAKLELVYYDLMSDNTMIKTIVEKGLSEPNVAFGVGTLGSGNTMAAIPAISKAHVPMFTSAMSDSIDEQHCEYLWLVSARASTVTKLTLDYLKFLGSKYGIDLTKIGIAYCDNEYGVSTSSSFQSLIEADPDLDYVYIQSYPPTVADMSPVVTALKSAGAEVIYVVPDLQDAKLFSQALKSIDYNPVVIGGGSGMLSPVFGEELGDDVQGILTTAVASFCQGNSMANPDWRWVTDTYNARYGGFNGESINTYIAYLTIIKQVLEATGTTDPAVNQRALYEMEFETPQASKGNIVKFNENRRNENAVNLMCQWQYVEQYKANIPVCVYPEEFAYKSLQFGN